MTVQNFLNSSLLALASFPPSMVNAVTGVLIECDTTVKAIIKNLDSKHHFIVDDLDDTHVFIVSTWVDRLKSELERLLDENAYTISDPKDPKN